MIINIRGTSGTGKSTVAREVMKHYEGQQPLYEEGRRQPIGYLLTSLNNAVPQLFVVGHYETPCGGTDTISGYDKIMGLVRKHAALGANVLYEGLLLSGEVGRHVQLHRDFPGRVLVIGLDVSLEECLRSVNERRRRKNPDAEDVNPKNTIAKIKGTQNAMGRLAEAGVHAVWADREAALDRCLKELGLS